MHTQNNLIRILRVAFEPSTGPENTNRYSDTPGLNIEKQKTFNNMMIAALLFIVVLRYSQ